MYVIIYVIFIPVNTPYVCIILKDRFLSFQLASKNKTDLPIREQKGTKFAVLLIDMWCMYHFNPLLVSLR